MLEDDRSGNYVMQAGGAVTAVAFVIAIQASDVRSLIADY